MEKNPLLFALLSAGLFGISPAIAKLLVADVPSVALAGFLYLGAFIGLFFYTLIRKATSSKAFKKGPPLVKEDLPWLTGSIIAGGIIAPIALMTGLTMVSGFATSLLLNLEGVATAIVAVLVFNEYAGKRLWLALLFMTVAGVLLAWNPDQGAIDLVGLFLIVLAMVCWGIDNNLTQHISNKDPTQIAQLKGIIAGTTSLSLAVLLGMQIPLDATILFALMLGALSYGLSLVLFIKALEGLGSSRTGAFFSFGPFIGAVASILILGESITWLMLIATTLMIVGVWMLLSERHGHMHRHKRTTHEHMHELDLHHQHAHPEGQEAPHSHEHTHDEMDHSHAHWPDQHHRHEH
ncbi:MAG: EamA family transporter [Methanomassiliicoccales archaeon]|nr:EamA family transporter [Methanomassiliicoccales archaeon]